MQISRYCLKNNLIETPVVFDALSRYEAEIGDELYNALKNKNFHVIGNSITEELTEMGMLVPDNKDEKDNLKQFLRDDTSQNNSLDITYALTFDCNMRCGYCIQADTSKESQIDENIFIDWVLDQLRRQEKRELRITFFGGEPLLKKKSITLISKSINSFCEKKDISFSFSVTTNGTLIDEHIIHEWKKTGLCVLDITLDGTQKNHDSNRLYKNGKGTFEDITANIEKVAPFVDVNIICNMQPEHESYDSYLEFLKCNEKKLGFKSIRFKSAFEKKTPGSCAHEKWQVDSLINIWKKAEQLGLPVDKDFIIGPCGFFNNNSWVISPGGDIYPCTPFMGNKNFSYGNIHSRVELDEKPDLLNNLPQECFDCEYCPICSGGCRFVSFHRRGSISFPTCEKYFFSKMLVPL